MFERFTDRARRVVVLAQEEARLLDHNYIGTEHLLLGLIHEGEGVAARTLESLGVSLADVRAHVLDIIGRGPTTPSGHIPFTPRAKKVLELSLREALQLGHSYIGTEHILLGLLREGEGVAAQVLEQAGVGLDRMRSAVTVAPRGPLSTRVGIRVPIRPDTTGPRTGVPTSTHCVFCGRDLWEVDHYVRGEGAAICDGCVEACVDAVKGAAESSARALSLPPRVFGADPEAPTAAAEIVAAFRAVFGPTTDEARAAALEDGQALTPFFHQAIERAGLRTTEVHVHRIRYSGDAAEVSFSLVFDGGGGVPLSGTAVQRGGRWLLSRESAVLLLGAGGVHIPPQEETG